MNSEHHKKEEWLGVLKEKVSQYQEPIPKEGWAALERELGTAKPKPVVSRIRLNRWVASVVAVAAIALFFWALLPLSPSPQLEERSVLAVSKPEKGEEALLVAEVVTEKDNPAERGAAERVQRTPGKKSSVKVPVSKQRIFQTEPTVPTEPTDSAEPADQFVKRELPVTQPREVTQTGEKALREKNASEKQTTWEEYLAQEDKTKNASGKNRRDWLALSAGNNGVGTFDPRAVNATAPASSLMQDASVAQLSGVKDVMLYKRPEKVELSARAEAIDPHYKHKQPLSFGVKFGKSLSDRFTIETGLVYSLLKSDIENLQKDRTVKQTLHYLGIPVRFNWNFVHKPRYAVYTGLGAMVEKCVYGERDAEKLKIKSVQTSLNLSVGAQYKFTPVVGIYFEPGLSYYLGMNKDGSLGTAPNGMLIKSIHSENPLGFTLQAGFRFSF